MFSTLSEQADRKESENLLFSRKERSFHPGPFFGKLYFSEITVSGKKGSAFRY